MSMSFLVPFLVPFFVSFLVSFLVPFFVSFLVPFLVPFLVSFFVSFLVSFVDLLFLALVLGDVELSHLLLERCHLPVDIVLDLTGVHPVEDLGDLSRLHGDRLVQWSIVECLQLAEAVPVVVVVLDALVMAAPVEVDVLFSHQLHVSPYVFMHVGVEIVLHAVFDLIECVFLEVELGDHGVPDLGLLLPVLCVLVYQEVCLGGVKH